MRKIIFSAAVSLDNFLAREDGGLDWLLWSDESAAVMKDLWESIDTILMGRKTYEFALGQKKGDAGGDSGIKTYVFSQTLPDSGSKGAEIIAENAAGFVRNLKELEGGDIFLMGGGDFAKTLFEAGLIDEISFNIHPILLGRGIPLFLAMDRQFDLELIESKPFKNGCVLSTYRVNN